MAIPILTPVVKEEKFHPLFKALVSSPALEPARILIPKIIDDFKDIDGNLVEQFQTTGFNQRLWELFLFQFFKENDFEVDRRGDNPDFFIKKDSNEIAVEALTSNPSDGDTETEVLNRKAQNFNYPDEQKAAQREIIDQTTIKLGSALHSKLQKKYWDMDHIKDKALIFAIEAFHHSHANNFPDYKMISYLYGFETEMSRDKQGNAVYTNTYPKEYSHKGKTIPYGFFNLPDAKNISAVIFTNTGNIQKFNRIGKQEGYGENVTIARAGTCYSTNDNAEDFQYFVGSGEHSERWSEGVTVCHNPNAVLPIERELFAPNRQIWITDGKLDGFQPEFFPFMSVTAAMVKVPKSK